MLIKSKSVKILSMDFFERGLFPDRDRDFFRRPYCDKTGLGGHKVSNGTNLAEIKSVKQ